MGISATIVLYGRLPTSKQIHDIQMSALFDVGLEVQGEAIVNAPYRSGNLRRSITVNKLYDGVEVGTNLIYGRIQEEGGKIRARNKPYLVFKYKGKWVKKKEVTIKARPYLKPALFDNLNKWEKLYTKLIQRDLERLIKR